VLLGPNRPADAGFDDAGLVLFEADIFASGCSGELRVDRSFLILRDLWQRALDEQIFIAAEREGRELPRRGKPAHDVSDTRARRYR
jgi:hypothetical protein